MSERVSERENEGLRQCERTTVWVMLDKERVLRVSRGTKRMKEKSRDDKSKTKNLRLSERGERASETVREE